MRQIFCIIIILLFCCQCSRSIPRFSGKRAFSYLEHQCTFGPRNPGSIGHEKNALYIESFLRNHGAIVKKQNFTALIRNTEYTLTNIKGSFFPERTQRILLGTHWDTRPWADLDPDSTKHTTPIIGANDGASGVATLLHIAEILSHHTPPNWGVDLVFFDGEDSGTYGDSSTWCLGSQHYVNEQTHKPKAVIIIDMIGDRDLTLPIEFHSYKHAPELVTKLWTIAYDHGMDAFTHTIGSAILDDQIPFAKQNIPAIDIIDFNYPYWHTLADTPEHCHARSLYTVGQTLIYFLFSS